MNTKLIEHAEDLQNTKAQLAQAEQEITAYDMTMNRQSKLIAELQAQLEAVGAGGVSALIPKAQPFASEREAFECWQSDAVGRDLQELSMNASGDYDCDDIQCERQAWQASAMLAAASQPKSAATLIPITSFVAAAAFASEPFTDDTFAAFQQGIRFAERVHGVGGT